MNLGSYFCGAVEMSLRGGGGKGEEMVFKNLCFSVAGISFFLKTKNLKDWTKTTGVQCRTSVQMQTLGSRSITVTVDGII